MHRVWWFSRRGILAAAGNEFLCTPLLSRVHRPGRLRLRIHLLNPLAIPLRHHPSPQFHAGGEQAILGRQFIRQPADTLFSTFQTGPNCGLDPPRCSRTGPIDSRDEHQLLPCRRKLICTGACPVFQGREVRDDQHRAELALIAHHRRLGDQGIMFERILNGLRRNELPTRGLIRSFFRSVTESNPSASRLPISPVLNQPSTKAAGILPACSSNS